MDTELPIIELPTIKGHEYVFICNVRSYAKDKKSGYIIGVYEGVGFKQGRFVAMSSNTLFTPRNDGSLEYTQEDLDNYDVDLIEIQ